MRLESLAWDSEFFQKRIARLWIENGDNADDIQRYLIKHKQKQTHDLIYVFTPIALPTLEVLDGCCLVDKKVVYGGEIVIPQTPANNVILYTHKQLTPDLERLAWISAGHSRYKVDKCFGEEYKRLYTRWMENSLNGTLADCVVCHENTDGAIDGMLTLKKYNNHGDIGLLAVDDTTQSKGVGTALVVYAKQWLLAQGINHLEVTTQQNNLQACGFYEKQGLAPKSLMYIYHYWL